MKNKRIIVTVEGGGVWAVTGIPEGYEVEVRDYDTDGAVDEDLRKDKDGNQYNSFVWGF